SGKSITTPFVTLPHWVEGECKNTNGFVYLAISSTGNDAHRLADVKGADLTPEWGLHLVDANIAMGDLVAIAKRQSKTHCARNDSPAPGFLTDQGRPRRRARTPGSCRAGRRRRCAGVPGTPATDPSSCATSHAAGTPRAIAGRSSTPAPPADRDRTCTGPT